MTSASLLAPRYALSCQTLPSASIAQCAFSAPVSMSVKPTLVRKQSEVSCGDRFLELVPSVLFRAKSFHTNTLSIAAPAGKALKARIEKSSPVIHLGIRFMWLTPLKLIGLLCIAACFGDALFFTTIPLHFVDSPVAWTGRITKITFVAAVACDLDKTLAT